jgi:hypothetical protein
MMPLALSGAVKTAWWLTLVGGLIVALVVWALLEVLRRTVNDIAAGVEDVLSQGGRLAQNTATIHTLGTTEERARELHEELSRHAAGGG